MKLSALKALLRKLPMQDLALRTGLGAGAYVATPKIIDMAAHAGTGADPKRYVQDQSTSQAMAALLAFFLGPKGFRAGQQPGILKPVLRASAGASAVAAPGLIRGILYRIFGRPTVGESVKQYYETLDNISGAAVGAKSLTDQLQRGDLANTLPPQIVNELFKRLREHKDSIFQTAEKYLGPQIKDTGYTILSSLGGAALGGLGGGSLYSRIHKDEPDENVNTSNLKALADYMDERERRKAMSGVYKTVGSVVGGTAGAGLYKALKRSGK